MEPLSLLLDKLEPILLIALLICLILSIQAFDFFARTFHRVRTVLQVLFDEDSAHQISSTGGQMDFETTTPGEIFRSLKGVRCRAFLAFTTDDQISYIISGHDINSKDKGEVPSTLDRSELVISPVVTKQPCIVSIPRGQRYSITVEDPMQTASAERVYIALAYHLWTSQHAPRVSGELRRIEKLIRVQTMVVLNNSIRETHYNDVFSSVPQILDDLNAASPSILQASVPKGLEMNLYYSGLTFSQDPIKEATRAEAPRSVLANLERAVIDGERSILSVQKNQNLTIDDMSKNLNNSLRLLIQSTIQIAIDRPIKTGPGLQDLVVEQIKGAICVAQPVLEYLDQLKMAHSKLVKAKQNSSTDDLQPEQTNLGDSTRIPSPASLDEL